MLDAGAVEAIGSGKSLLPVGVTAVEGEFQRGAAVACRSPAGREIARGLVNYSSAEARRIARHPGAEIEALLGYMDGPELIHRDNLVLMQAAPGAPARCQAHFRETGAGAPVFS